MSGHSHFSSIKHKKAITDARRSKEFSRLAKELTVAARDGGGDPDSNSRLRVVIEKARSINMPTDNTDRAIKRGTGEGLDIQLEEILWEAYGPGNIAILIEGITDNKNRSLGEIKQTLNAHQGKLVEGGGVRWLFERRGVITIAAGEESSLSREDLELAAIEAGTEDTYWHDEFLDIYTKPEELELVKGNLPKDLSVESATLDWVPKDHIRVAENDTQAAEKLFEALDENEAVQEIYSNLV